MHGHHQGVLKWAAFLQAAEWLRHWRWSEHCWVSRLGCGLCRAFGGAVCRPVCGVFTRLLSVPPFLTCLLQSLEQLEVMLSFFLSLKRLWRDTFNFNAWALAVLKLFSKNGRCFANENKALSLVLSKILLLSLPFAKESDFLKSVSKQIYVMTAPLLHLPADLVFFFFFNFSVCRAFWGGLEEISKRSWGRNEDGWCVIWELILKI